MKPLMSPAELRSNLERGISNGWWTIEDLDTPSWGWNETNRINPLPDCQHLQVPPRQYTNPLRTPEPKPF